MIIPQIWKSQPGRYFFLSTKSGTGKWAEHSFERGSRLTSALLSFCAEHSDKDIYFCPRGFQREERKQSTAAVTNLLWADLDEADPRKFPDVIRPTWAIESSPGRFAAVWLCDGDATLELNKKLTYFVGADKSGWDSTQVLRVPGTRNYKYKTMPKVRLLWSDGPIAKIDAIKKHIGWEDSEEGVISASAEEVDAIIKKYWRGVRHGQFMRTFFGETKEAPGKRSDMMHKLAHECIESGVPREEAILVLASSRWNKWRDKPERMYEEFDKAYQIKFSTGTGKSPRRMNASADGSGTNGGGRGRKALPGSRSDEAAAEAAKADEEYIFLSRSMAEVEEEDIDWIWYPYLARCELTILEGDPDLGKSYAAQMMALHIVDGKRLPSVEDDGSPPTKGKVAYFDIENSAGSVTKKRLKHNGIVNMADYFQEEYPFTIDNAMMMTKVMEAIERLEPTLVVFDTMNTYLGSAGDTYKANEAQMMMQEFRAIAKRYKCAVMVLRHLTKSTKGPAMYRGQGSIAFSGLARVVITAGRVPEEMTEIPDARALAVTKFNLGMKPGALCYTIKAAPEKGKHASVFEFHDFIHLSSDEMLQANGESSGGNGNGGAAGAARALDECVEWLRERLANGPVPSADVFGDGEKRSYSQKLLRKAFDAAACVRKRDGFGAGGCWTWELPSGAVGG